MTPLHAGHDPLAGLRSLDAAPPGPLSDLQASRAESTLATVLATGRPTAGRPTTGTARRRTGRRVAVLAGLAVTGAVLFTVVPGGPGGPDPAFATWQAVPDRLPLDAAGEAVRYCQENGGDHTDAATEAAAEKAVLAFAERRGVWTYVLLAGPDGFGVSCLTDSDFEDGMIGSAGAPTGYRPPGRREIVVGNCCGGGGTIRDGVKNLIGEVDGYAGPEVASIVVRTPARGPVEATLGQGRFAAWWPDNDSDTRPREPLTFDVTFTDGTSQAVTPALRQ